MYSFLVIILYAAFKSTVATESLTAPVSGKGPAHQQQGTLLVPPQNSDAQEVAQSLQCKHHISCTSFLHPAFILHNTIFLLAWLSFLQPQNVQQFLN